MDDGEVNTLAVLRREYGISAYERDHVVPDWEIAALILAWNRKVEAAKKQH